MIGDYADQVWARAKGLPDDCWDWPGAKTPVGYGKIGREGKTLYTHRVAYEGANGAIPGGMVVMHSCDNPGCCNPAHLQLGSKADNSADMVSKRRNRAGEDHHNAKLTARDVETIRTRCAAGETQRALSREYGVTFQHVSAVVNGNAWRLGA